jgi:hypothetical protein
MQEMNKYDEYITFMAQWQERLLDCADVIEQSKDSKIRYYFRIKLKQLFGKFIDELNDLETRLELYN